MHPAINFSFIAIVQALVKHELDTRNLSREGQVNNLSLLRQDEVARILGVSPRTLNRWRHQKLIKFVDYWGDVRYTREQVESFIKSRERFGMPERKRRTKQAAQ